MTDRLRYPELAPELYSRLQALGHAVTLSSRFDPALKAFVELRASQINGCHFCIEMHANELRKHHEPESRIAAIPDFRSSDAFTPREKAALAWTETLTDLPGGTHASDADYAAVREFFDGKDLVDLSFIIATINAYNRLGVAFKPAWDPARANHKTEGTDSPMQDAVDDDGGKVANS